MSKAGALPVTHLRCYATFVVPANRTVMKPCVAWRGVAWLERVTSMRQVRVPVWTAITNEGFPCLYSRTPEFTSNKVRWTPFPYPPCEKSK